MITFEPLSGFVRQGVAKQFTFEYGSDVYEVTMPDGVKKFPIGSVMFTEVGMRLGALSNAVVVPDFDKYFIEYWKKEDKIEVWRAKVAE